MIQEQITIPGSVASLGAYYAHPDGSGPYPGLIVIHEAYGLNDNIRQIAERFAAQGYAALAVDLFHGRNRAVCMAQFFGGMLFSSLNNRGIRDLKASLDYLAGLDEVDENRIGAIGFCMGGSFAIAWACTDSRLKVVAPFYGMNPRPLDAVERMCPVVGSYPENDFTASAGQKLKQALDTSDIPNDIKIYPGARHSFFNDQGGTYDPNASEDAWQRTLAFFAERLGSA